MTEVCSSICGSAEYTQTTDRQYKQYRKVLRAIRLLAELENPESEGEELNADGN